MACSWRSWKYSAPFGWPATFSWPLVSLRPARNMSLGRWLLVACFSSVKNHNVWGPHLFPSFTTYQKNPFATPRMVLQRSKNHFAIGRNSERCCYHIDLSRFVLPISDPSALNLSKFVGVQDSPNLSKIEKVAETCEFDGKELSGPNLFFFKNSGWAGSTRSAKIVQKSQYCRPDDLVVPKREMICVPTVEHE